MKKSESKGRMQGGLLFLGFFFFICVGVGAFVIYSGIKDIIHTKVSLDWPHTSGKIVSSSVEASQGSTGTGRSAWHADIEYEYTVNSQSFINYRVSFGDYGSSDKSHAQGMVSRYPVGITVAVYYQPDDPGESILEPAGTKTGIMLKLVVGSVFLFLGVFIALAPYLATMLKKRLASRNG